MLRSEAIGAESSGVRPDLGAAVREGDRVDLATVVAEYQEEIGALEPGLRAARALADPDAAVIVTGQQPGLLGGPLLTLTKALSAIAWARRLATESGRSVIPVFWAASEDHDLDEVNRVTPCRRGATGSRPASKASSRKVEASASPPERTRPLTSASPSVPLTRRSRSLPPAA